MPDESGKRIGDADVERAERAEQKRLAEIIFEIYPEEECVRPTDGLQEWEFQTEATIKLPALTGKD